MRGAVEGGVDLVGVAEVIVERDVVGDVIVKLRCAGLGGILRVGDRGQGVDIDLDRFRRVAGLHQRFRDHERDGIADIAHLVGHQRACGWSDEAACRRGFSAAARR